MKNTKITEHSNIKSPPPPNTKVQSNNNTFLGNIFQGLSFGTGSSIANKSVDAIFSSYQTDNKIDNKYDCNKILDLYSQCIINSSYNFNDTNECKKLYLQLGKCFENNL
jgi:hypothetical protein